MPRISIRTESSSASDGEVELCEEAVLLFGWSRSEEDRLRRLLANQGVRSRWAESDEVLRAPASAVVFAPLRAVQELLAEHKPLDVRLIVASKDPEEDLPTARAVGARNVLATPIDGALLLRAIHRNFDAAFGAGPRGTSH